MSAAGRMLAVRASVGLSSRRVRLFLIAMLLLVLGGQRASAQTEVVEYYGQDALGSIRIVFDASGVAIARADYEPFGETFTVPNMPGTSGLPAQQFTGQERDAEASLDYFGARFLAPRTGRFSQVDPAYAALFDPQQWNRYAYVRNNPVSLTDPTGMLVDSGIPGYCHPELRTCEEPSNSGGGGSGEWGWGWVITPKPPPPPPPPTIDLPDSTPPDCADETCTGQKKSGKEQIIEIDFDGGVFIKSEDDGSVSELDRGTKPLRFDGLAIPSRYPCMVFKVSSKGRWGFNSVKVDKNGKVTTTGSNLFIAVVQSLQGGWKWPDWQKELNEENDPTWDGLFAVACTRR